MKSKNASFDLGLEYGKTETSGLSLALGHPHVQTGWLLVVIVYILGKLSLGFDYLIPP